MVNSYDIRRDITMKNGEYIETENVRWCEIEKQFHGPLYVCEHYPQNIKDEINKDLEEWQKKLSNPDWVAEQIKKGVPKEVIAINKFFAGLIY